MSSTCNNSVDIYAKSSAYWLTKTLFRYPLITEYKYFYSCMLSNISILSDFPFIKFINNKFICKSKNMGSNKHC